MFPVANSHIRIAHYAGLLESSRLLVQRKPERRKIARAPSSVFTRGSGQVRVRDLGQGVWSATYSGVIGEKSFAELRLEALFATQSAKSIVVDMTAALSTMALYPEAPKESCKFHVAPGVVICRPDQIEVWERYAIEVRKFKIARVVFLETGRAMAREFAAVVAGVQTAR